MHGAALLWIEYFTAANGLCVLPIFNFDPSVGVWVVLALPMLGDYTFKIFFADQSKKTFAFPFDMIYEQKVG